MIPAPLRSNQERKERKRKEKREKINKMAVTQRPMNDHQREIYIFSKSRIRVRVLPARICFSVLNYV